MQFHTHVLKDPLLPYIESVFHYENFVPDHSIERVVPTGHLFIIFELDGMVRHTFDNESLEPNAEFTKVWISGMHKNCLSISAHPNSEMFVIQFKPFGAHPFLHLPVQELNNKVVDAQEVLGEEILQLHHSLLNSEGPSAKFQQAEDWLLKRFDAESTPPEELLEVIYKLQREPVANYAAIVDGYSKTQKHLIDQFKKYVGLTPKYYQRILRFNEILLRINNKESIEWSQIAYQCEYSDQSHFIKEFKHFSGINPQKFIKENFHQQPPNFFPLDRKG